MLDLRYYSPSHRYELEELLRSDPWQDAIGSGLVDEVRARRIEPGNRRDFIGTVVEQLLAFNEPRVRQRITGGQRDADRLLADLSRWPDDLAGRDPTISFLGLNVTSECNNDPRCIYCNQPRIEPTVGLDGWKRIVAEVAAGVERAGPYIYITGGEPLMLGEDLWGPDGLVRFATARGARVNVNTNAMLLTPEVALRLIEAGLGNLHISLDSDDKDLQDSLAGGPCYEQVLRGIYNVQLARDLVGATYPIIHTNCVLTNRNLDAIGRLFAFLLDKHKQTADKGDPFYNDLFPHVIPVGGSDNAGLRPTAEEFRRFYGEVVPELCDTWDRYLERRGLAKEDRPELTGFFRSPFHRVQHQGGLDAYVQASAAGQYGKLALVRRCYVAPTQASFTPDGNQHYCGSHAIRRILPLGNATERGVFANIRAGIAGLEALPTEDQCYGCALATLYINQSVEARLAERLRTLLAETDHEAPSSPSPLRQPGSSAP
jgi:pyruvate-formate lyase-activating enzyme